MLRRRRYSAPEAAGDDDLVATKAGAPDIRVVFVEKTFGIKAIRDLQGRLSTSQCRHLLVVHNQPITSFAKKEVVEMQKKDGMVVETFATDDLQFDLTSHVLVPRHTVVKPAHVASMGASPEDLPVLLASDPVARWHHWGPGTVVRVRLTNPEGHEYDEYRRVA